MIAVLYLFLVTLVAMLRRDLLRQAQPEAEPASLGQLVVLDPGPSNLRPGQALPLQATTSVGRDEHNVLVLRDSIVSSRHAILTLRDGTWWLRDLDSTNGTQVNQQQIRGEVALEGGDVLGFGRVRLKLAP